MELVAGLLGAVVGGAIAALVGWWQTRAALRHELQLHREALAAEREAGRAAVRRAAAVEALRAIAALDAAMPHMDYRFAFTGQGVPGYVDERRTRAQRAVEELRHAEVAVAPLLGRNLQRTWNDVVVQADEASRTGEIGGEASRVAAQKLQHLASDMHRRLVEEIETD